MTLGEITTKARGLVNATSGTYSDANLLIDINIWYQKVVTMILESQDEANFDDGRNTDYPILTTALVANQRDYSIPVTEKMLKLDRLDVTYDGVNWYKATPIDEGEMNFGQGPSSATTQEATIDGYFDKRFPKYDIKYNSFFIYPRASTTDVSNGATMQAQWSRQVTPFTSGELTTGTVIPGFDDPFHPILSYGPAFEFAESRNLPQAKNISGMLQDYEARMRIHYSNKQKDRQFVMRPALPSYRSRGHNDWRYGTYYNS